MPNQVLSPQWLPPFTNISKFEEDVTEFIDLIYDIFKKDFIENKPKYKENEIRLKNHPMIDDKEAAFWHLITEGPEEETRSICLERCKRIPWPRPVILNNECSTLKVWKEYRSGRNKAEYRIHLFLENPGYLVVLNIRNGYYVLWTAYPVEKEHRREKLLKRFQASLIPQNAETAS